MMNIIIGPVTVFAFLAMIQFGCYFWLRARQVKRMAKFEKDFGKLR